MITQDRALSIALGALLLLPISNTTGAEAEQSHRLALDLFEEANWRACRAECTRNLVQQPSPTLQLMHAVCGLRAGIDASAELQSIIDDEAAPLDIKSMAHYEWGRALWEAGNQKDAFPHLYASFQSAQSVSLHRRAGCSLAELLKDAPELRDHQEGLVTLLATCSREWDADLRKECRKPMPTKSGLLTIPARGLISFYQHQIGPAIGARCSLHPSCSRYASSSLKTHGLIGIGMIGDRFIREPSEVGIRKNPIKINGRILYHDPLSDHDFWFNP